MLFASLAGLVSPAGGKAHLSILIFHNVLATMKPERRQVPDVAAFDRMLGWLRAGFRVLPLEEALQRLQAGTLPARAAAITFDDGYADNLLNAVPVLKKHGLHATFFIATGFLDGGIMWNDALRIAVRETVLERLDCSSLQLGEYVLSDATARGKAIIELNRQIKHLPYAERAEAVNALVSLSGVELPSDLMLTSAQLRELHGSGMGIGGHTISHPILAACDDALAWQEISEGKRQLESIIGDEVRLFAYPNGRPDDDYRRVHVDMVREAGYQAAVSTAAGAAWRGVDPYQIPRFTPWRTDAVGFKLQLVRNVFNSRQHATQTASL